MRSRYRQHPEGCGKLMSSSSGISWGKVTPTAAPSVAAKLRLMARFAALAGFDDVLISFANPSCRLQLGGAYRDRTDDLMLAKQPLSQLS